MPLAGPLQKQHSRRTCTFARAQGAAVAAAAAAAMAAAAGAAMDAEQRGAEHLQAVVVSGVDPTPAANKARMRRYFSMCAGCMCLSPWVCAQPLATGRNRDGVFGARSKLTLSAGRYLPPLFYSWSSWPVLSCYS